MDRGAWWACKERDATEQLALSTGKGTNAIISLDSSFKCKEKHAYWQRRLCYMTDLYVGF